MGRSGPYKRHKVLVDFAHFVGPDLRNDTVGYTEIVNLVQLVSLSLQWAPIPDSIGKRPASSALQAARYLYGDVQRNLESEQWKLELEYWFAIALARLLLEIFNIIEKPLGVDEAIPYNQWEGIELKSLCRKVKFYSPNHTTLSTVGIVVIMVVVVLLTLGNAVEVVFGWVPLTWAKKLIKDWDRLEKLKLLMDAEKYWAEDDHTGDDIRASS